ncbi:MAG: tetratricopeptide repeat protein [Gemmatimonadota bacterium]
MTRRSAPASWTASPTACSATSTSTAGRRSVRPPPASGSAPGAALAALLLLTSVSCAYLNTLYNAQQAYDEGVRLSDAARDSLPAAARVQFERAAEKSGVVLDRYGDTRYADDALLLLGRSLLALGSHADASASFQRLIERFPESDLADAARLGLAQSERRRGDLGAAEAALAPLLADADEPLPADVLYEQALIALGSGAHEAAVAGFRDLLAAHPGYARERGIGVQFADAELAAGQVDAALAAYTAFRDQAPDPAARAQLALRIANALSVAGRPDDALTAYGEVLEGSPADSLAARIQWERGVLFAAQTAWADAEDAWRKVAELAPGTAIASRATLARGRMVWRTRGERAAGLEILLDAFLHAPLSAAGDSARAEARALARVIHYEDLASGETEVAGLVDTTLARSTALYRLAEEVLEAERDPAAAARLFARLGEQYPETPWRPRALLAAGLLAREAGDSATGTQRLHALIAAYPDDPASDSARRALDLPVPDRAGGFYGGGAQLRELANALPDAPDPLLQIVDQMDRYGGRRVAPRADPGRAIARPGPPPAAGAPPPPDTPPETGLPPDPASDRDP